MAGKATPKPKAPKRRPIGRPTDYNDTVATYLCRELSSGRSLKSICAEPGMPDRVTVYRWTGKHEEFRNLYVHAREAQADALFDEILDIADNGKIDVQRLALRIQTRKWIASHLQPNKYGDKLDVKHAGGVTIVFGDDDMKVM